MKAKILFIALDAGDKDLILQWAKEGVLPTFQSLLERAAWGITANPVGLYVGAVWPSFYTGVSPAKHGRYCFAQIKPGTYDKYRPTPYDVKAEPFWNALSRAGQRIAIIDVPKSFPSVSLNGIQLVDWGTHDKELTFCTWPETLAGRVQTRFGKHPVPKCDSRRSSAAEFRALRDGLISGVEKKCDLACHFLDQGDWDLFLAVFGDSHCAGHQCWHIHDPAHPRHDKEIARSLGDPIKDVYVAIDAAMDRILKRVGRETTVFILASHGMGPHYDGTFLLNNILYRLEKSRFSVPRRKIATSLKRAVGGRLSDRAKNKFSNLVSKIEYGGRKCFQVPNNDVYGAIRVNLIGREPHGRIKPGAEYETFCDELTRALLSLVNLDTGKPVVLRVLRTADLYSASDNGLPDLLVEWDRDKPISRVFSPKTGEIRGIFKGKRTGDHKPQGVFFAAGPWIKQGYIDKSISVMDFAPTLASILGVPLPNVEGQSFAHHISGDDSYRSDVLSA